MAKMPKPTRRELETKHRCADYLRVTERELTPEEAAGSGRIPLIDLEKLPWTAVELWAGKEYLGHFECGHPGVFELFGPEAGRRKVLVANGRARGPKRSDLEGGTDGKA